MRRVLLLVRAVVACFSAVALTGGCGGRVDLGGGASGSASGATVPDAAASTYLDGNIRHVSMEYVVESNWYCLGVAVDDKYLYMMTGVLGELNAIRRCLKNNCAATLSQISGSPCSNYGSSCQVDAFERLEQRLVISQLAQGGARFDTCTLPDCADGRTVIDKLPGLGEDLAFDEQRLYFTDLRDPAIYSCALPDCVGGPKPVASGVSVQTFTADRGDVYWSDGKDRVSRTRGDGSASVEEFDIDSSIGLPDAGRVGESGISEAGAAPGVYTGIITLDGEWLYATVTDECGGPDPCQVSVVRWPRDFSGPRERLAAGVDGTPNDDLRVFDGEVVFQRHGNVWSCRADDCAGTERMLDGAYSRVMAADNDYIYWCRNSSPISGVSRAPRIAH